MISAFFCISTRRVSISLYQRARYSSFVQGTLPASQLPTESLSNGRHLTRKQVHEKKGEKKPKRNSSPQLKVHGELARDGIKLARERKFIHGPIFVKTPGLIMLGGNYLEKVAAQDKEDFEFSAEWESRHQTNIGDVESGKKK